MHERTRAIKRAEGLSAKEKYVLRNFADYCVAKGQCYPGSARIADESGPKCTVRFVNDLVNRLAAVGIVRRQRVHNGAGRRVADTLTWHWELLEQLPALEAAQAAHPDDLFPLFATLSDSSLRAAPAVETRCAQAHLGLHVDLGDSLHVDLAIPSIQRIEQPDNNTPKSAPVCVESKTGECTDPPKLTPDHRPLTPATDELQRQLIVQFFTSLHGNPPTLRQLDAKELDLAARIIKRCPAGTCHATAADAALDLARVVGKTVKHKWPDLQRFTAAECYFDTELARRERIANRSSNSSLRAADLDHRRREAAARDSSLRAERAETDRWRTVWAELDDTEREEFRAAVYAATPFLRQLPAAIAETAVVNAFAASCCPTAKETTRCENLLPQIEAAVQSGKMPQLQIAMDRQEATSP